MALDNSCLLLHIHLTSLFNHAGTSLAGFGQAIQDLI